MIEKGDCEDFLGFNQNHPECLEGERFITNTMIVDHPLGYRTNCWNELIWKTKRRGEIAYDYWGKPIPDMYPIFVSKEEIAASGIPFGTETTTKTYHHPLTGDIL